MFDDEGLNPKLTKKEAKRTILLQKIRKIT